MPGEEGTLAAGIPRSPLGPDVPPWAEVREFRVPANGQQRQPAVPKDARATATSQREVSRSQEPPSATATAAATAATAAAHAPAPLCSPALPCRCLQFQSGTRWWRLPVCPSDRPTNLGARAGTVVPRPGTPLSEVTGRRPARRCRSCRSPPEEGVCEAASSRLRRRPERKARLWRGD